MHQEGTNKKSAPPDNTAVRTALWRALHLEADAKPPIFEDETGLKLAAPKAGWQQRPDMHPDFTKRLRASVVARARFVEDLVVEAIKKGTSQYIILGAGLDTFAQRHVELAPPLQVFEIDEPLTQQWKQQRLAELGLGVPPWLHFVAVDFETSGWWENLLQSGFDKNEPAFLSCTGVSLYLSKKAIISTLAQIAQLPKGSTAAMTFYLPIESMDEQDKPLQQIALGGAREAGTPMISFFTPEQILALASQAGLTESMTISTKDMQPLYFASRTDGLAPASGEVFLIASL